MTVMVELSEKALLINLLTAFANVSLDSTDVVTSAMRLKSADTPTEMPKSLVMIYSVEDVNVDPVVTPREMAKEHAVFEQCCVEVTSVCLPATRTDPEMSTASHALPSKESYLDCNSLRLIFFDFETNGWAVFLSERLMLLSATFTLC